VSEGFDFTQPERREPKGFEPPPWEKEAFEELRRRREQAPAQADAVEGAESGVPGAIEEPAGVAEEKPTTGDGSPRVVEDREVVVMLASLAAEEPNAQHGIHAVALSAAAVLVVFGLVLVVWGVVALVRSGRTGDVGLLGGSLFLFFGVAAVGFAVWLTVRTLRQRGVL
jgi:hypothetical protein